MKNDINADFIRDPKGELIVQQGGSYVVPAPGADPVLQHRTTEPQPPQRAPAEPTQEPATEEAE